MTSRRRSNSVFQPDLSIKKLLEDAQYQFGVKTGKDIYELRLNLATSAITTAEKSNAPAIGLPTLDGFLSYVAFRAAFGNALKANPELSKQLLWQWNIALRHQEMWIDFDLPLRKIPLTGLNPLYDCSIGLPVDVNGDVLIPVGAFFTSNSQQFKVYPEVVDSIPLRRRISEPFGRPIGLKSKLNTGGGSTKALDNRLYFPLTQSYAFLFRGDKSGVERLLDFALKEQIGFGKKTTLGYGQLASFEVRHCPDVKATWTKTLSYSNDRLALIKSLPYDRVFARRDRVFAQRERELNQELLGCERFALIATIETYGAYRPPYWLRQQRTQIVRYGSIIQKTQKDRF